MKITIAETAGFCFGVERAVALVRKTAEKGRTATYGEIIHNPDVVRKLAEKGVRVISSPDEAEQGETVVIRSHGVPDSVFDALREKGVSVEDGTCPYVSRIHKIVRDRSAAGFDIIIVGDKAHPEVIGIAGSCSCEPKFAADSVELKAILDDYSQFSQNHLAIVVQTTYNMSMWQKCLEVIDRSEVECEISDTICRATNDRQTEAARLASQSDIMIILGGRHSSNTKKLYDICREKCPVCFLAENASELDMIGMLKGFSDICDLRIGITAGASTPAHIIKEVKNQMSEKLQNMDEDFNFEEALDASFKRVYTGNRVKGYITAVNKTEAIVDIGAKQTGYVSLEELTDDPALTPADVVSVGDEVEFIVLKVSDLDGCITLSKKKVDAMVGFDKIVKAKEEDTVLEGVVTSVVKGGVLALTNGIKVFIPASQATMRRDEKLDDLLKKTVNFKIIEVNEAKGKAVGSIKQVLSAERDAARAKFWESVQVGDVFKGEVKSITNYGAFVDLGGIDGMVHISELSWNRIKHPSEVVSVGDVLEVYVKDLDKDANRISLGYKKDEDNPMVKFSNEYSVGDVVKAKIVSITPFGAFAQIIPGIDGLIHISQIADKRVTNVKDVLSIGDEVEAKITEIDTEKKRISLSIRALSEGAADAE